MTPNELFLTFGGLHPCVKFGENRQRNATVRVMTHGQTDRQTDRHTDRQTQTDFIICPIAICYSYGADNKSNDVTAPYVSPIHGFRIHIRVVDTIRSDCRSDQIHVGYGHLFLTLFRLIAIVFANSCRIDFLHHSQT